MGDGPGRPRRIRNRPPRRKTMLPKPLNGTTQQPLFPTEQMRATRHIEKQRIRTFDRHDRRKAIRPNGQCFQLTPIRRRIVVESDKSRRKRFGVSQRLAAAHPQRLRRSIDVRNPQHTAVQGDCRHGRIVLRANAVSTPV